MTQYQYSLDVIADNTVILEALVDETKVLTLKENRSAVKSQSPCSWTVRKKSAIVCFTLI